MARLVEAEAREPNPHLRDDLRIARRTVMHAAHGDATFCSPHVLASYEVLGLHPDKVWPAIQARQLALGFDEFWGAELPPKKPPVSAVGRSQQKLWSENTNAARAVNSRGEIQPVLREPIELMGTLAAVRPTAALYRNPVEHHSGKSGYSLAEVLAIVDGSGAPHSVRALTISALLARGEWPHEDGPATNVLSVAILGIMLEDNCCRSTVQRRIKRAMKDNYWRRVRSANSWTNCPKCGKARSSGKCESCPYRGRSKDEKGNWTGEFMRVPVYEFDIQKFRSAPRCREIRHFDARTYAEYKAAAKRGEHPNVTEMPRKPAQPTPAPSDLPPTTAAPRKTAEHRSTERRPRELTSRERAKLIQTITELRRGITGKKGVDGLWSDFSPNDPRYFPPLSLKDAIAEACKVLLIPIETARDALKLAGFELQE